jgi:hypothetical protein
MIPANSPGENMVEPAKPSSCGDQAQHIIDPMKQRFTSFRNGYRQCGWRRPRTMWSCFQRYMARRRQCAYRPVARLMRALYSFERDLRQHRKRVARQYNCELLLRPGTAVPTIVLVLQ